MLINFDKIQESVIPNFRGGEKNTLTRMFTDEINNRIMYVKLEPGASIGFHKHDDGSEIIYVLNGSGKALYDDTQEILNAGICHYCPKGHSHSILNDGGGDLIFFAVIARQ